MIRAPLTSPKWLKQRRKLWLPNVKPLVTDYKNITQAGTAAIGHGILRRRSFIVIVLRTVEEHKTYFFKAGSISTFKFDFAGQSMDSLGRPLTHTGLPHSSLGEQL